jgi:hypothetical protein
MITAATFRHFALFASIGAALLTGCESKDVDTSAGGSSSAGRGGSSAKGGSSATGGTSASAGAAGSTSTAGAAGTSSTIGNGGSQTSGGTGGASAGANGGTGGSSGTGGSAAGTGGSGGSTVTPPADEWEEGRQLCVDKINEYRATVGKAPLERWKEAEDCVDAQAANDAKSKIPHEGFQKIGGCGMGQNECPGYATVPDGLLQCLGQMWAEGPTPDGSWDIPHGHYMNMFGDYTYMGFQQHFTKVACGFAKASDGGVWSVQNFQLRRLRRQPAPPPCWRTEGARRAVGRLSFSPCRSLLR